MGSVSGWGRSPGEGLGNPLQSSCLENPKDKRADGLQPMGGEQSDTQTVGHARAFHILPASTNIVAPIINIPRHCSTFVAINKPTPHIIIPQTP